MIVGMAMTYRPVDRSQEFLLPPNMADWLSEDHLVWFIIEAVRLLDTSEFHRLARLGGVGRRGYDPDMLLTLFCYAMAHGVSSSRRIERLCATDVAFRVICAQDTPDHTVLARFRKDHAEALTGLLAQSLVLAAELGMVSLGVVALDGTKIAANASKDANHGEAHLRSLAEKYVDTVNATDTAEDALFDTHSRGDEMPPDVRDRSGRAGRIQGAIEQIEARHAQAAKARQEQDQRIAECRRQVAEGTRKDHNYPRGTDRVEMARIRYQRERAAAAARYEQYHQARSQGTTRNGRPPSPPDEHFRVRHAEAAYQAAAAAERAATGQDQTGTGGTPSGRVTANTTDPESRLMKTRNGWIQGYNCQTATSSDEFIISARVTQDTNDKNQFIPTMTGVTATATMLAGRTGRTDLDIGVLLADAGYDSHTNLTATGPARLIPDSKHHTINQRASTDPAIGEPDENASPREKMNHRLRTSDGHKLYKRRAPMIEASNAWLKDRRGLRRFARRGLAAAQAELSLACAVTNLLKIATHGVTAPGLRTR
jgi:transposase